MASDYADYGIPAAIAKQVSALGLATKALQATADQIAAAVGVTGVPLITNATLLESTGYVTLVGGGTVQRSILSVTQIAYEIRFEATIGSTATVPFVSCELTWIDSGTNNTIQADTYIVPAADSSAAFQVAGRGPTKADQVQVTLTNLDPAVSATVSYDLFQNSRVAGHDRWEWMNAFLPGVTVPGWTLPSVPADRNVLGIVTALTIGAGAFATRLFGMCDSLIQVGVNMNTGTLSDLELSFAPVPSSVYGVDNPLGVFASPAAGFQVGGCRAPIRLIMKNSGASSITVTLSLTRAGQPPA